MTGNRVRVAAVADLHVAENTSYEWVGLLKDMSANADILVIAGDLTNRGLTREAEVLIDGLSSCRLPVVAVLGNHDYECGHADELMVMLRSAGIKMLEDEPCEIDDVGFAGLKGFCGGFDEHALASFGEELIKQFVRESVDDALKLESGLQRLRTEHTIAVLHYAPIRKTVEGEPSEIFPFMGSSRLADPIDHCGASAVVHGHAHHGSPEGVTTGGVPVYNVALPLMRSVYAERPYRILEF